MMDEGAGDLDSESPSRSACRRSPSRMDFDAGRDVMLGNVQTLTANKDEAFDLLRLAMTKPRFDADAIERVRAPDHGRASSSTRTTPRRSRRSPGIACAFPDHPYGRPIKGTMASIAAITPRRPARLFAARVRPRQAGDLRGRRHRCRDARPRARPCVRRACRQGSALAPVADAKPPLGPSPRDHRDGRAAIGGADSAIAAFARKDDDFIAAYILNYIIGGGGFSSRLMEEVREKRGLAYSVHSNLYPLSSTAPCSSATSRPRTRRSASRSR